MSAQGKLSPKNCRRLMRIYELEQYPIVDAIATHDSWVVFRTIDRQHVEVHRRTGQVTQRPCRNYDNTYPGAPACWQTCRDLPSQPVVAVSSALVDSGDDRSSS